MDLDQIKSKLNNLQNASKGSGEKKDYSKIFWSPKVGEHEIRIVPSAYNQNNPFTEIKVYYGIGPNKVMISPLNFGEKDPIFLFAEGLKAEYNKENYYIAKKLEPKTRIFVPVIVRGEEEKGVRLWQFGKSIYEELLGMAIDDEIGDYTDITSGRDIKLTTVGPDVTKTAYNKTTIRPKMKTSKLSSNKEEVELWLSEQPNPMEQFKKYTFDEMKDSLQKWLYPESQDDEQPVIDYDEDDDLNLDRNIKASSKNKFVPKQNKKDEWKELFSEDEDQNDD